VVSAIELGECKGTPTSNLAAMKAAAEPYTVLVVAGMSSLGGVFENRSLPHHQVENITR
jgi:hypothetical protein